MFYSFLNRFILLLVYLGYEIKCRGLLRSKQSSFSNIDDLVDNHFQKIGELDHACRESLSLVLNIFDKSNRRLFIIETGSSAWGTNSTILFDEFISYLNQFNQHENRLFSCDIRINPMVSLINNVSINTTLVCNDSVSFLNNFVREVKNIDCNFLIYLDSFDLDYSNANPSGLHGFKEFLEIIPLLKKDVILIIDDSPVDINLCPEYAKNDSMLYFEKYGFFPGKGMFIDPIISKFTNVKKIFHKYQIIYKVE